MPYAEPRGTVRQFPVRPAAHAAHASAGDLERDDDDVARRDSLHRVAGLDHLRDALVPERERLRRRDRAGEERRVQVAHRHRERPHERLAVALQPGAATSFQRTSRAPAISSCRMAIDYAVPAPAMRRRAIDHGSRSSAASKSGVEQEPGAEGLPRERRRRRRCLDAGDAIGRSMSSDEPRRSSDRPSSKGAST